MYNTWLFCIINLCIIFSVICRNITIILMSEIYFKRNISKFKVVDTFRYKCNNLYKRIVVYGQIQLYIIKLCMGTSTTFITLSLTDTLQRVGQWGIKVNYINVSQAIFPIQCYICSESLLFYNLMDYNSLI